MIRFFLITYLSLFVFSFQGNSQKLIKTQFLDKNYTEIDSISAEYIRCYYSLDVENISGYRITKDKNGNLDSEIYYSNLDSNIIHGSYKTFKDNKLISSLNYSHNKLEGPFFYYFESEKLQARGFYKENKLDSSLVSFYESESPKRKEFYKNGELIEGQCFSSKGVDTSYFTFETEAEFDVSNGTFNSWIVKNVNYPNDAIENNISEKIYVRFQIGVDGKINKAIVVKGITPSLKKEALRVIEAMPNWKAATFDGENISCDFILPINFTLAGGRTPIDPIVLEKNIKWKKGTKLKDPFSHISIEPKITNGVKIYTVYYSKYNEVYKKKVTEIELEYLTELKFNSRKSLKKYYRYY